VATSNISRFMDGDKVKIWPAKRQMRLAVLEYLASKFELGKTYTEKEVDQIIDNFQTFSDHATIRRELFDNSFLNRDDYGTKYWKEEAKVD
jgi:hypothetical protein